MGDRLRVFLLDSDGAETEISNNAGLVPGFADEAHFAEWFRERVVDRVPIFPNVEGSDTNLIVDTGGGPPIHMGAVYNAMHQVGDEGGGRIMDVADGLLGVPLIAPAGDAAIFHYVGIPQGRNPANRLLIDNQPLRYQADDVGIKKTLKSLLTAPKWTVTLNRLRACTEIYPVIKYPGGRQVINTPEEYCTFIRELGCFQLAFYLRFDTSARGDIIRKLVKCPVRKYTDYGGPSTGKVAAANRGMNLLQKVGLILAEKNMCVLSEEVHKMPVTDVDILEVCLRFGVIGYIYDVTNQVSLNEIIDTSSCPPSGIVSHTEVNGKVSSSRAPRRGASRIFAPLNWKISKHVKDVNNILVMVGYCQYEQIAHLELVTCPRIEKGLAIAANNNKRYTVVYSNESCTNTKVEFKLVKPELEERFVSSALMDISKFVFAPKRIELCVSTIDELRALPLKLTNDSIEANRLYEQYTEGINQLPPPAIGRLTPEQRKARETYDNATKALGDEFVSALPDSIGARVQVDRDVLTQYADEQGRTHTHIPGLVYLMREVYRSFNREELLDIIHFCDFDSSLDSVVARKLCVSVLKSLEMDPEDSNRMAAYAQFNDVSTFSVRVRNPSVSIKRTNGKLYQFALMAKVSIFDAKKKEVAEKLVHHLLPEVKDVVYKAVLEKEKSKMGLEWNRASAGRKAAIGREVKRGMRGVQEAKELFESVNIPVLAERFTTRAVHERVMRKDPRYESVRGVQQASLHNPAENTLRQLDPQIDEPVVSVLRDKRKKTPPGGYFEVDGNINYSLVQAGRFDSLLPVDWFGDTWRAAIQKRPVYYSITYEGDDFLWSYEADCGYVFIGDVDWDTCTRDYPDRFTSLSPFYRYRKYTPDEEDSADGVGTRQVSSALVIATCIRMAHDTDPKMTLPDKILFFKRVQRDLFRIKSGVFNVSESTRRVLHATPKGAGARVFRDIHLQGVHTENNTKTASNVFMDAYDECILAGRSAGLTPKESYKHFKSDLNLAVGTMKSSGIRYRTTSNLFRCDANDTDKFIMNVGENPVVATGGAQLHICPVPDEEDLVLVQQVDANPVFEQGTQRDHRIDILTRASFIFWEGAIMTGAFGVRTDAIYTTNPDPFIDWIESGCYPPNDKTIGQVWYPRAETVLKDSEKCKAANCTEFYGCDHCTQVCPWDKTGMRNMPLIKIIYREGVQGSTTGTVDEIAYNKKVETDRENTELALNREMVREVDRRLSPDGQETLISLQQRTAVQEVVLASSFLPDVYEEGCVGIDRTPRTIEEVTVIPAGFNPKIGEHFILFNGGAIVTEEWVYSFYNDIRGDGRTVFYDQYEIDLCKYIEGIDAAVRMDGPPGSGKSTIQKRLIRRKVPGTHLFVDTATHGSLNQFRQFHDEADKTFVSTIYSFFGVHTKINNAASNPQVWLGKPNHVDRTKTCQYGPYRVHGLGTGGAVLIIDEYEMLPIAAEELLYCLHKKGLKILFVGDEKQTAPMSQGIRCSGALMTRMTNNKLVSFDIPFRCADPIVYKVQQEASMSDPRKYLSPLIVDYVKFDGMESDEFRTMCTQVADKWIEDGRKWISARAGTKVAPYSSIGISAANHKLAGMVTLWVIEISEKRVEGETCTDYVFSGSDEKIMGKKADTGEIMGDGTDEPVDPFARTYSNPGPYVRDFFHSYENSVTPHIPNSGRDFKTNGNPAGEGFYVGTRCRLYRGRTYKAMTHFKPSLWEEMPTSKDNIKKGSLLVYLGCYRPRVYPLVLKTVTTSVPSREEGVAPVDVTGGKWTTTDEDKEVMMYRFMDCTTDKEVCLTLETVQAHVFYPFAMYSGSTVGHTYETFYVLNVYSRTGGQWYTSIKDGLDSAATVLGNDAWESPRVKQMNVAATRVAKGNKAQVYDIYVENGSRFWREDVATSDYHISGKSEGRVSNDYQVSELLKCRESIGRSKVMYSLQRPGSKKKRARTWQDGQSGRNPSGTLDGFISGSSSRA